MSLLDRPSRLARFLLVFTHAVATLGLLAALPVAAGGVVNTDALANRVPPRSADLTQRRVRAPVLSSVDARLHERLGTPTIVLGSEKTPVLSGVLEVQSDPQIAARRYLRHFAPAFGLRAGEDDDLRVDHVQDVGDHATLVRFEHWASGIPVFRERISVLLRDDGTLAAIGGQAGPVDAVSGVSLRAAFRRRSDEAVRIAIGDLSGTASTASENGLQRSADVNGYEMYSSTALLRPARVRPVYFRHGHGVEPAYYTEVEVDVSGDPRVAGYVVSAKSGAVLFRHDLTDDATAYGYRVFSGTAAPYLPYSGPAGRNGTPHPTATPDGYQAPMVSPNLITLVNAITSPTSPALLDPWLPDGATQTTGNNVDAFANLTAPDDFQAPGDFRADVTGPAQFDRTFDTAISPLDSPSQSKAAVTHLFYLVNWLHDWYYDNGFNESAGNAQNDNYGRGGLGGDRLRAQGQDYASRNNANMFTPADGAGPRMRMYVYDGGSASRVVNSGGFAGLEAEIPGQAAAGFGPVSFALTNAVVEVADGTTPANDGCETITNNVTGKIALIRRGTCAFTQKVANAQAAGAIGALIYNNAADSTLPPMGGTDATITIPSLGIRSADGNALASSPVPVSLRLQRIKGIDRDGTLDSTTIAHEWGHFISNRLVQDASGLSTNQANGMGEGFADFHALLMSVRAQDAQLTANANFTGAYAVGNYVLGGPSYAVNPNQSFYYGYRRYPYSTNRDKNPLTLRHIANGVALPTSPSPAFGADGASNSEVHNTGEVWASALWECYSGLLLDRGRLTFDQARERMKSYLVAGYQLMPPAVDFVEARDAILAAAIANDPTDFQLCAAGFARRGLGAGAQPPADRFGDTNQGVVESFSAGASAEWIDAAPVEHDSCDDDGVLDNGEQGRLHLTLRNDGVQALAGASVSVSSPDAIVQLAQPTGTVPVTLPLDLATVDLPIRVVGAAGTPVITLELSAVVPGRPAPLTAQATFRVNSDDRAAASKTETFEAETLFAWTPATSGLPVDPSHRWQRQRRDGDAGAHVAHGPDVGAAGLTTLQTPPIEVSTTQPFSVSFAHRYAFEFDGTANYDAGVIEVSQDNGVSWQDVTAAGGSLTPAYNGQVSITGGGNPLEGRNAYVRFSPSAGSGGFDGVTLNFGTSLAGRTVRLRFAVASDGSVGADGWDVDDIAFSGIVNQPFPELVADGNSCADDLIFGNGFQ